MSHRLYHLFFSSLFFCVACSVLCCAVLCCVAVCGCVVCVGACLCVSLCHVSFPCDNPSWANFGKQNVCSLKTPPCVRSKRHRVYQHHTHMCLHMWTCCRYTRRRFGCTHGFFQRVTPHTTPQRTAPHTHTHTTTTATATATHDSDNDNDTQPTNLQLHATQHGKTHQVQTRQGLTDRSFLILRVVVLVCSQLVE